jgi:hypothetical protein
MSRSEFGIRWSDGKAISRTVRALSIAAVDPSVSTMTPRIGRVLRMSGGAVAAGHTVDAESSWRNPVKSG